MLEIGDRARMLGVTYDCIVLVLDVTPCKRARCRCGGDLIAFHDPYDGDKEWSMHAHEFARVEDTQARRAA
jgi:hypothetical protein